MTRRLIVCFDGTWNAPEKYNPKKLRPTNVLKLSRAILPRPSPSETQILEYIPGIGTHDFLDWCIGGVSGWGISRNIRQGYQFLVNNYHPGDEIWLFGFSRGAYTARSLSGFLEQAGILKKSKLHLFPAAYMAYRKKTWNRFKADHPDIEQYDPNEVKVRVLGLWDTVGALGIPVPLLRFFTKRWVSFHSTQLGGNITAAFHALALHERRKPFAPALWTTSQNSNQKVEQMWFVGGHSDIGGGLDNPGFSDAALDWMLERACNEGLKIEPGYCKDEVRPDTTGSFDLSLPWYWYLSTRWWWWPFQWPDYLRPIGENHLDDVKPQSLNEYIHPSAVAWLDAQLEERPRVLMGRRGLKYLGRVASRARELRLAPSEEARSKRAAAEANERYLEEAKRRLEEVLKVISSGTTKVLRRMRVIRPKRRPDEGAGSGMKPGPKG